MHTPESGSAVYAAARRRSHARRCAASLVIATGLASCGLPRDADHTLEHVRRGIMRVGVVDHPPWAHASDSGVSGVEPTLVADLARQLRSRPEWQPGAESELLLALHERKLDVVIGGLTSDSPWKGKVALTHPYEGGKHAKHVLAVAPGENAWLMRVEEYLETHGESTVAARTER